MEFEAGKTYIEDKPYAAPEVVCIFKCEAVLKHPSENWEHGRIAIGWGISAYEYVGDEDCWQLHVVQESNWAEWNEKSNA